MIKIKKTMTLGNVPELPYATEEAVSRLRVNLGFCGEDKKKIMIISSMPNEGKSFITFHLWRQFAQAGVPVVLVDTDIRKSVVVEKLAMTTESEMTGTSDYLANDIPASEILYHTNIPNGDLVPNIVNVVNPSILLESSKLRQLLDALADQYRYVLIDTPPLNMVADGERIASMSDGAVLVIRAGETPKALVRNSIGQLTRAECPLLGTVLNRVGSSGAGYYYKRYGTYYGKKYEYNGSAYYYGKGSAKVQSR